MAISSVGGGDDVGERIRWRDLSERIGIPFTPGIHGGSFVEPDGSWSSEYFAPDEGYLPTDHVQRLAELLATDQPHYFWYEVYTPHGLDGEGEEVLYRGTLLDLPGTMVEHDREPPTYWWPEDRSWCVCVDWDLSFTVVGGSRDLVDSLHADDVLETIEIGKYDEYMSQSPKAVSESKLQSILSRRSRRGKRE
jgi:hypothetical protein